MNTCVGRKIAVRAKSRSLHTILCKSTILYVIVCMDRDFDTEIGPRFCNRGCAKSRSDCMYVVWSLQRDHTIVWYVPVDSISCMVVAARLYYCMVCTGRQYKLYGRCSATIQYTVHARRARRVCAYPALGVLAWVPPTREPHKVSHQQGRKGERRCHRPRISRWWRRRSVLRRRSSGLTTRTLGWRPPQQLAS